MVKVFTDRPPSSGEANETPDDPEALFREARRRRRIRRAWWAGGIVLILLVAVGVIDAARTGPGGRATSAGHSKAAAPSGSGGRGASVTGRYSLVQLVGVADDDVAWAASDTGLFVTTNGGRGWRTVTPPNLEHDFLSEHVGSMDAVGKNDLWLVLVDVPGLVPYSQSTNGSDRGGGIDRSTDGGRTWTFSALPGCIQSCGASLFVSFVDPDHGFAAVGPDLNGPTQLFSTADGGVTWTLKGDIPDLGGILSGGPGPEPQLVFTSPLGGWAVTGPTFGVDDQTTSPGGILYRTTDGGTSWSLVSGLPSTNQYELPTFFGTQDGVVLSNADGVAGRRTGVYVTEDGGSTWTARPLPNIPGLRDFKPRGLQFRFTPLSPASWKIDVGSALYSTINAGRTWVRTVPRPKVAAGTATAVVFTSSRDGLALWSGPPKCDDRVGTPEANQCFPTMVRTTDGGSNWTPVTP